MTDSCIGTGVIAQVGIWILAAIVWSAVFSHDLMLFSAHPVSPEHLAVGRSILTEHLASQLCTNTTAALPSAPSSD